LESTTGNDATGIPESELGVGGFEVAVRWQDHVVVLGVSGTLDMVTAPQLTESIMNSLKNEPTAVIVDLSDVEFLASAGMTVLIAAHEQIGNSAQFAVVAEGPATGRPMHLVGVDRLLTIHTSLDAALEASSVK
jgi:anti-anti-sigma factor